MISTFLLFAFLAISFNIVLEHPGLIANYVFRLFIEPLQKIWLDLLTSEFLVRDQISSFSIRHVKFIRFFIGVSTIILNIDLAVALLNFWGLSAFRTPYILLKYLTQISFNNTSSTRSKFFFKFNDKFTITLLLVFFVPNCYRYSKKKHCPF